MKIPEDTLNRFKAHGYSEQDILNAYSQLENDSFSQFENEISNASKNQTPTQLSTMNSRITGDFLKLQLEVNDILERIQHILKNDVIEFDKEGNRVWKPNPNPEEVPLNDYGVHLIMSKLTTYINRDVLLSNLDDKTINKTLLEFGKLLSELIYYQAKKMGMDTDRKIQLYESLILQIVDLVYVTWRRAYGGQERATIGKTTQVNENILSHPDAQQSSKPSIFNPRRYFGGRL